MTLRHMRIFVAVGESQSMTKAARALGMAQPAVSLAIAELEAHYGQVFFDRISGRLHITEAGRQCLQYALQICRLFESLEQDAREREQSGTLRIGASITIGNCLLPGYIRALKSEFPGVQPHVYVENSDRIEQRVLDNEVDLGLVEGEVRNKNILSTAFLDDRLIFVCPPGHPFAGESVRLQSLVAENLIVREKGSAGRSMLEGALASRGITLQPSWQCVSTSAMLEAVGSGFGVALLPQRLVRQRLERGEVACFEVEGLAFPRSFNLIQHKAKLLGRPAEYFRSLCLAGEGAETTGGAHR